MDRVFRELRVQAGTENELAPYMHTPPEVLPALARSLQLKDDDSVLEIGCGDARILCYLAQSYACALTGVEIDQQAYNDALEVVQQAGLQERVRVLQGDAMSLDLPWDSFTVVFMYLTVSGLKQVWESLKSRLRAGTRIVSIQFQAPEEHAEAQTDSFVDHKGHNITFTFYTYFV